MAELNIVFPEEIEYFIQSLKKSNLCDIGTKSWLENHEFLVKLDQQAIIEARENREEIVKEFFVLHDKV